MESFLLFVLVVVLIIRWAVLSRRYSEMEGRIEVLLRGRIDPSEMTRLIQRVTHAEAAIAELKRAGIVVEAPAVEAKPEPEPKPKPEPVQAPPPPKPAPEPQPVVTAEPPKPKPAPPVFTAQPSPPPAARPVPPATQPARPSRTGAEWEALVGGNWMNKLGILAIVIALALALGYEVPKLGPAGISAIALTISLTMLVSGVIVERRERYTIFARGLIAGGWAGLYFTVYAMHAIAPAKVIDSTVLGATLLIAVATGMVVHSLRYRDQTVTGLAYFVAFATLAITEVTALSVVALVPLAASLLFIAQRFEWKGMALFGLLATYATCATRPDTCAPLWQAQSVFAAYWLVFEVYDLWRTHRRSDDPLEAVMLPLNAMGLSLLSYAKWSKAAPDDLYMLSIGVASAYLVSTVLRAVLRPPASFPAEAGTFERILAGGYEGPVTLAAACSAAAAILKLHGQAVNNVLLAEGEVLFLAGLYFRQAYPRRLAATLFASLGVKLFVTDMPGAGTVILAGRTLKDWTPSATAAALLFYVNRVLRKVDVGYGYAASALVALIVWAEVPLRFAGITWLAAAAILFLLGWSRRLLDFRVQGYLTGVLGLGGIAMYQLEILDGRATPLFQPWISLAVAAGAAYVAAVCALRSAGDRFVEGEREQFQFVAAAAATGASMALLWKLVPDVYLGPAWMALSLVILELGLRRLPPEFRWHAQMVSAAGALRVVFVTIAPFHPISGATERIAVGSAALASYLLAARMFRAPAERVDGSEARRACNAASAAGSFFVLVEMWALLDPVWVAPVWALFALALIAAGFALRLPALRLQGHATAIAALARLFAVNFDAAYRVPAVAIVIAAHYAEAWRQRRLRDRLAAWERLLDRPYLYTAAGLMICLLYRELQPPFVSAGWALFMLALLAVGRTLALADLRYQSYALAALVFGRVLLMEFPVSTAFADAEQRIVVGAVVTACLSGAQLLIPRERQDRLFYSLLATTLATALLFQEVSGSMLTVAWGVEGAVLLAIGFPLRDRTLRLSGMVLFLVCVSKLFLYDLRTLETVPRILSFAVLGAILLGVSWLYTRFREQIQRYL